MPRPILRTFTPYFEAGTHNTVSKETADAILLGGARIIAPYLGRIAVEKRRGLRIPDSPYITPGKIRIPSNNSRHSVVVVGRPLLPSGNTAHTTGRVGPRHILGETTRRITADGLVISSSIFVDGTRAPEEGKRIFAHEIAHSFGAEHCEEESCIMYPELVTRQSLSGDKNNGNGNHDPFCSEHIKTLAELAAQTYMHSLGQAK